MGAVQRDPAPEDLAAIESLGIGIESVCAELLTAGVKSFADAFDELLEAVDTRRREATATA